MISSLLQSEAQARDYVRAIGGERSLALLDEWVLMLTRENEGQNLVSRTSLNSVWLRHIADSAQVLQHVPRETTGPWLDFGSGAGFPGIVLAALRVDQEIILIESRKLRIDWLRDTIAQLGLLNCRVIGADAKRVPTVKAGLITARAFAPLQQTVAIAARFSTSRTQWVLPKGRSAAHELAMLPQPVAAMFHVKQSITDRTAALVVGSGEIEDGSI